MWTQEVLRLEGQAPAVSLALDRQAEPVLFLARVSLSGIGWVSQQGLSWGAIGGH